MLCFPLQNHYPHSTELFCDERSVLADIWDQSPNEFFEAAVEDFSVRVQSLLLLLFVGHK